MEKTRALYSDRVKLDSTNRDAVSGSYKAMATYKDGETIEFTYIPGEHTTYNGDIAIGQLMVPGREYPVEIKEREGQTGKYISGCLNYDEKKFCNLKKQPSSDNVDVYTISFSKPDEEAAKSAAAAAVASAPF